MQRVQRPKRSPTPTSATFPADNQPSQPVPPPPPPKPLYLCSPFVEAALVKGNFKTIVILPKYVDIMEWVAVNSSSITRFFHLVLLISNDQGFFPPSFRFLHKSQRVLRRHSGMLHPAQLSDHVSWLNVRFLCWSLSIVCTEHSWLRLNYTWINQERKSVHLPAPTYIDYVMTWVQNLLDDENSFPTKSGMSFTTTRHL